MNESLYQVLSIDMPPLLCSVLAAVTCGLLGNYLVLRRMSLMGDAISHSVLPGLVIAFLLTGARTPGPMFAGAAASGVVTAVLVEALRRMGRIESGTAMGVTFSILFALGVLLLEQAAARQVDLDADCVLHGQLETLFWFPPRELRDWTLTGVVGAMPRQAITLFVMLAFAGAFVWLFFKELKIASFDPGLATALGMNATAIHLLLMVFVAGATVAAFEAVGSILVVGMLICPAATARLLTDRLTVQIWLSVLVAIVTSVTGYVLAVAGPGWFGVDHAVSVSGMSVVTAGMALGAAIVLSPTHGIIARVSQGRHLRGIEQLSAPTPF